MEEEQQQQIKHNQIIVGGLSLHVAEIGTDELGVVVFLHGFPEIWYSWRHQMTAVANAGYRAIAPDFRGYGLSQQPPDLAKDQDGWSDLVEDLHSILDILGIPKVFLVAKDFGARPAFLFALEYPARLSGLVTIGVPFSPRKYNTDHFPKGCYLARFNEPGRAEADFDRFDVKTVIRNIYILFSGSETPTAASEDEEIMDLVDPNTPLPSWFSEEDLAVYASLYEKSGFRFPLQMPYRKLSGEFKNGSNPKLRVPSLLIMGEEDYVLTFPGMADYIKSGIAKDNAPHLEIKYIAEGSHFVQEQFPEQVNKFLINFLKNQRTLPVTIIPIPKLNE